MAREEPKWIAEFALNDGEENATFHLMIMWGGSNKGKIESAFNAYAEAHNALYPHLRMNLLKLYKMESVEQVERLKEKLRAEHPNQSFADEMFPDNPNQMLFRPLDASHEAITSGRAEEALIRMMCDGMF
jgi:hypothetical protein